MIVDFLLNKFRQNKADEALVWHSRVINFGEILDGYEKWNRYFKKMKLQIGSVVALEGDYSPSSISLLIALIDHGCIVAPLTRSVLAMNPSYLDIAEIEMLISVDENEKVNFKVLSKKATHPLLMKLRNEKHPGLVVFTSGSTGKSKAIIHDLIPHFEKYSVPRNGKRMICFLLFDHLGGFNTLMSSLSTNGCLVILDDRSPNAVLGAVEKYKVQVLPTSPTFVNLMLISEAYKRFNLDSLETVTYGTEPMPESVLKRFHELFPKIKMHQTYGLSETGVLRSKSKSSDSLWVKVGGEGVETRVREGLLEIKTDMNMLGYLNAPSPFTNDGWFKTGDMVEVDGEYLRFLGRKSEIINVGGEKVFPSEVENIISQLSGVEEVIVQGESNPLTGNMVKATVKLTTSETLPEFRKRLWAHCAGRLTNFKIPQKIVISKESLHTNRFKKNRAG